MDKDLESVTPSLINAKYSDFFQIVNVSKIHA